MTPPAGLDGLGWHPGLATAFVPHAAAGRRAARVVAAERGRLQVHDGVVALPAQASGRLRFEAGEDPLALPSVGDWVALSGGLDLGTIHAVLPRRSAIVRHAPVDHGRPAQAIAANVDVAFIVTSLNAERNPRRLERYLAIIWESGATPVVLLSKADLDPDAEAHRAATAAVAVGAEVLVVSARTGVGLGAVRAHLAPGRTACFIGSSGVGKSTLVNALAGRDLLATSAIREDDARGRHTTSRRQLLPLADGLVIDTPGMRELGLLDGEGLASTFEDLERVAAGCRFRDCRHEAEPGCAVRSALAAGSLDPDRLRSFRRLEREARRAELASDPVGRKVARRRWAALLRDAKRRRDPWDGAEP